MPNARVPRRPDRHRPRLEELEARLAPTVLPPGFTESLFTGGISDATCMGFAPDGRLFVCQHQGDLRVVEPDGTLETAPFLHVDVDSTNEHGLVGMTFDPDFVHNGYVYIYYTTADAPIHSRVSRFTADPNNPNAALPGSENILLELDNLTNNYHVGGAMHFGIDGKLYVGVGEDGNPANAQDGSNLLGKMLRINADGSAPADNPFVGYPGIRPEIYAFGFRNPFRFAVQPRNGLIYVNDVGSDEPQAREEVNRLYWGGNYGWPIYEGYSGDPDYTDPLYDYEHGDDPDTGGYNCAITGATFYGPGVRQYPRSYVGDYFFADFCGQWIKRYDPPTGSVTVFAAGTGQYMIDLAVDAHGSLYYLGWDGLVYRITYSPPAPPGGPHLGQAGAAPVPATRNAVATSLIGPAESAAVPARAPLASQRTSASRPGVRATEAGHPPWEDPFAPPTGL
jgi:glucose/arabinose dehydrogenase